jgi:hypothetical protein
LLACGRNNAVRLLWSESLKKNDDGQKEMRNGEGSRHDD